MATSNQVEVTVIIPTMAEERRRDCLLRAINSIFSASIKPVHVVVVVNGHRRSEALMNDLRNIDHVELLLFDIGSAPLAQLVGRRAVRTRYFCFLDDDDEYLPGGIDTRVALLESRGDLDFVVTNGYRCLEGVDRPCFNDLGKIQRAPLVALFNQNWLASCGSLFRSERIGIECFEEPHPYVEWTWLAFKLCMTGKEMAVLDQPTFRINDTPNSVSKSMDYTESFDALYRRMLEMKPPKSIVSTIRQRIGECFHCRADVLREQGKWLPAWKMHLKSLFYPGGWRYLPFSRHLLFFRTGK